MTEYDLIHQGNQEYDSLRYDAPRTRMEPRSCGPSNDRFSPHLEEEGEETPQTEPPDYLVWSIKCPQWVRERGANLSLRFPHLVNSYLHAFEIRLIFA